MSTEYESVQNPEIEVISTAIPVVEHLVSGTTEVIATSATQTELVETATIEMVSVSDTAHEVLTIGVPGPPGPPRSLEEVMYAKRVDMATDTTIYRGEAPVGSLETEAVWRIRRMAIAQDGDISEEWANGTAEFRHIWTERTNYEYR